MQTDSIVTITVGIIGILSSIIAYGVGQGVTNEKLRRIEKDIEGLQADFDSSKKEFVTFNHLDVVIEPMKNSLKDVQHDVKEILHVITAKLWPKA